MPRGVPLKGAAGNIKKQTAYAHAWGDIRKAIATGHYAQAVTRQENIIRDRLISYLSRVGEMDPLDPKGKDKTLYALIKIWKRVVPPIPDVLCDTKSLQDSIDGWRKKRNASTHEMVISDDIKEFKSKEKDAAVEGERLAKSLQNWYRREKDRLKKEAETKHTAE